jgi:hypothetical protein
MLLQVAFDDPIDQPDVMRFLGADHPAASDHLKRLLNARDARETLGAASTGEKAKLDLGNAELRRRNCNAVMAAKRDLEPTAKRGAVDCGYDQASNNFRSGRRLREATASPAACRIR